MARLMGSLARERDILPLGDLPIWVFVEDEAQRTRYSHACHHDALVLRQIAHGMAHILRAT